MLLFIKPETGKNKMDRITLTDNHRRSVSSSIFIIEKMMLDIEKVLLMPDHGVLIKTENDLPQNETDHYMNAISDLKVEIDFLAVKYNLRHEETKVSRFINSRKAKMWETVTDTSSRKLKGFKEFPAEIAEEFDSDIARLKKLIDKF
jgi:hypothetical protein